MKEQNTSEDEVSGGSIIKVDGAVEQTAHQRQSDYKIAKKKWNSTAYLKTLNEVKCPEKVMKRKLANMEWNELKKQIRYANGAVPRRRRVMNSQISKTSTTAIPVVLDTKKDSITLRPDIPKYVADLTNSPSMIITNEPGVQEGAPSGVEKRTPYRRRKMVEPSVVEISDSPIKGDMRKKVLLSIDGPLNSKKISIASSSVELNAADMTRIFQVPLEFYRECDDLLTSIGKLSKIEIRDGKFGLLLSITSKEKNPSVIEPLLTADMGCKDITMLLTQKSFLSQAPIEYYRCLLMRDEMLRSKSAPILWKPSFIASTLFMTILREKKTGIRNGKTYQFEKAYRHQDRVLIGESTRPTEIKLEYCLTFSHSIFRVPSR